MTEKELKKLGRAELLQLLLKEKKENERLQGLLDEAVLQLAERRLECEKAGTLAEAALKLNGIFEAADEAAKQYLDNLHRMTAEQDVLCAKKLAEAQIEADAIIERAMAAKNRSIAEADAYWLQVSVKVQSLLKEQEELKSLLNYR